MFPKLCVEGKYVGKQYLCYVLPSGVRSVLALTFGGAVLGFPPTVLKAVQTPFKTPVAGRLTGCCVSVYPPSSLFSILSPISLFFQISQFEGQVGWLQEVVVA